MKSSRRGGYGTFFFSVDGLITIAVRFIWFALHIVGESKVTVHFEIGRRVPFDKAFTLIIGLNNGSSAFADFYGATVSHLFSWAN